MGFEFANLYIKGIPLNIKDKSNELKLDFYERFNPDYYNAMSYDLRDEVVRNMLKYRILPYDSSDWNEFYIIKDLLSKYHKLS